jgi:hypothetical protein
MRGSTAYVVDVVAVWTRIEVHDWTVCGPPALRSGLTHSVVGCETTARLGGGTGGRVYVLQTTEVHDGWLYQSLVEVVWLVVPFPRTFRQRRGQLS